MKIFSPVFPQVKVLWNVLCLETQSQKEKMINQWEEMEKSYNDKVGYQAKIGQNK